MKKQYDNSKYGRAKKRVDDIKGFYSHLTVYLVINVLLIAIKLDIFDGETVDFDVPDWSYFTTPLFWGIGLFFHGLWVFGPTISTFKKWEERKIKKFMQEDLDDEEKMKF